MATVSSPVYLSFQLTPNNMKCSQKRQFSSSITHRADKKPLATASTSSNLPQPRFEYRAIADNVVFKSHNAFNRKAPVPVGAIQSVNRLYDDYKRDLSSLNSNKNSRSKLGEKIRKGTEEEKIKAKELAKLVKETIDQLERKVAESSNELFAIASALPNDTHPDVPIGPEEAAVTIAMFGPEPMGATPLRDHVAIGRALDLLDFEAAATITGSSWYYLLNEGALLEMALTQYALSKAIQRGFTPATTPDVVKADVAMRCGFQPRDVGDPPVHQMYHLQSATPAQPELVLSGTAEIPLAGLFANKVYKEEEFPLKVVGLGRAFRSEAGARGADTRGLYRVHQFSKLELFVVCKQEKSEEMMKEILDLQVDIFNGLGLPLR